jgi:hypothetical protein
MGGEHMASLDHLIELAWNALPADRLRIERTIMLVIQARETVLRAHWMEQQAWERLARAKAVSQRLREDDNGHLTELQIIQDSYQE